MRALISPRELRRRLLSKGTTRRSCSHRRRNNSPRPVTARPPRPDTGAHLGSEQRDNASGKMHVTISCPSAQASPDIEQTATTLETNAPGAGVRFRCAIVHPPVAPANLRPSRAKRVRACLSTAAIAPIVERGQHHRAPLLRRAIRRVPRESQWCPSRSSAAY